MITIYYKPGCGLCSEAKKYFISNNIEFEAINLSEGKNREARKYYRSLGIKDLPVIAYEDSNGITNILQSWNDDVRKTLNETRAK